MASTTLGERIKGCRQSLSWTQDKLAQEAGISKSFLSEIENDKANVSGENLMRIANALDTSLDYLMKGEAISGEVKSKPVEVPAELSELAEELSLSHKATITLLTTHNSLIARRSAKEKSEMTKEGWRDLYQRLRNYLE
jgi:transcriptional regulator with XRE-family HTH domain